MVAFALVLALLMPTASAAQGDEGADARPNILVILADDMGYGDVGAFNPDSKISTPHLDRLADQGRRFTDAHSPGSVCVPTRYGLMTGRYPIREELGWTERAVIDSDRTTLASLLRAAGYRTAMIGKWHLGLEGGREYDCSEPLRGGPVDRGFDRFFGMPASLDIPPYFYIRGRDCVAAPTDTVYGRRSSRSYWSDIQGPFWRRGGIAPGFRFEEVLPRWREKAVAYLEDRARSEDDRAFFLYLALTAPHTPWLPAERFRGTSGAGMYGDFTAQVDDLVGSVMQALDRLGMAENTLVVFTSDNGPVWYENNEHRFGHASTGPYRGMKGDVWEGGHRMPFIVRWPGQVPAGTVTGEPLMFTDLMATFAGLTDQPVPEGARSDSYNMLPALLGRSGEEPIRDVLVHPGGYVSVRKGPWKLIPGLGSGGFTDPRTREPGPGEPEGQLYHLGRDPEESENLYGQRPEKVEELRRLFDRYRSDRN